jgi:hypothetical protein
VLPVFPAQFPRLTLSASGSRVLLEESSGVSEDSHLMLTGPLIDWYYRAGPSPAPDPAPR